ncbi:MAG: hypothetical protein HZB39_08015 [Planctomycetes bacterium]|nr:hypothetical protein [Planctomycetota bacterium]
MVAPRTTRPFQACLPFTTVQAPRRLVLAELVDTPRRVLPAELPAVDGESSSPIRTLVTEALGTVFVVGSLLFCAAYL